MSGNDDSGYQGKRPWILWGKQKISFPWDEKKWDNAKTKTIQQYTTLLILLTD